MESFSQTHQGQLHAQKQTQEMEQGSLRRDLIIALYKLVGQLECGIYHDLNLKLTDINEKAKRLEGAVEFYNFVEKYKIQSQVAPIADTNRQAKAMRELGSVFKLIDIVEDALLQKKEDLYPQLLTDLFLSMNRVVDEALENAKKADELAKEMITQVCKTHLDQFKRQSGSNAVLRI